MIVVLVVERMPASVRGDLSRWMIEPRPGVFIGQITPLVRDRLWSEVGRVAASRRVAAASAVMVNDAQTEQGFEVRVTGTPTREVVDFEGLTLVRWFPVEHEQAP